MSEFVVTTCDLCNVNQNYKLRSDPTIEADAIVDAEDNDVVLCNGPGYIFTDAEHAIEDRGWRETDYGHQCPVCAAEEDEQNAVDEAAEMESGATLEPTAVVEVALKQEPPESSVRKPQPPKPPKKAARRAKKN